MNKLQHLQEFEQLLSAYQPNDQVKQLAAEVGPTVLVGPSGSGRNTIINQLVKTGQCQHLVSDTTRIPRSVNGQIEREGEVYYFKTEQDVLGRLKQGKYLEAAIIHGQQVSGISVEELERAKIDGRTSVVEVEIVGALNMLDRVDGVLVIFIIPPSFDEWMSRLDKRGELDQDERRRRLKSAEKEIETVLSRDDIHIVVNNRLEDVVEEVKQLIDLHRSRKLGQYNPGEDVGEVAWRLLNELKQNLHS